MIQTRASAVPSLIDSLASIPDLEGRSVCITFSLPVEVTAACRVHPRPDDTGAGNLPRRANAAFADWLAVLRRLGIVVAGLDATLRVPAGRALASATLDSRAVDRLRGGLEVALGECAAEPHDLIVYTRAGEPEWRLSGLTDLPAEQQAHVRETVDAGLQPLRAWLRASPGCALLLPGDARPWRRYVNGA